MSNNAIQIPTLKSLCLDQLREASVSKSFEIITSSDPEKLQKLALVDKEATEKLLTCLKCALPSEGYEIIRSTNPEKLQKLALLVGEATAFGLLSHFIYSAKPKDLKQIQIFKRIELSRNSDSSWTVGQEILISAVRMKDIKLVKILLPILSLDEIEAVADHRGVFSTETDRLLLTKLGEEKNRLRGFLLSKGLYLPPHLIRSFSIFTEKEMNSIEANQFDSFKLELIHYRLPYSKYDHWTRQTLASLSESNLLSKEQSKSFLDRLFIVPKSNRTDQFAAMIREKTIHSDQDDQAKRALLEEKVDS